MANEPGHDTPVVEQEELDPELYTVPARLTGKDIAGVVVALLLLAVIGISGYIWLNPELSYSSIVHRRAPESTAIASGSAQQQDNSAGTPPGDNTGSSDANQLVSAEDDSAADLSCAQCGMDSGRSGSHVVAKWDDASENHFDSWDCVFSFNKAQGLTLASAQVSRYRSDVAVPEMLPAAQSWYLYDTKTTIKGSMPPYVAAFRDQASAQAEQASQGGEVVDFAGLGSKWE